MAIIKKCFIIRGENSVFSLNSTDDVFINNTIGYDETFKYEAPKNHDVPINKIWKRFFRVLRKVFWVITDLFYGLESGYKPCCIKAYIIKKDYSIPEVYHKVCKKCYKEYLKTIKLTHK